MLYLQGELSAALSEKKSVEAREDSLKSDTEKLLTENEALKGRLEKAKQFFNSNRDEDEQRRLETEKLMVGIISQLCA